MSDHECSSVDEAQEKLRLGMTIFIRRRRLARIHAAPSLVRAENERRICFCTDDRNPADLLDKVPSTT
jgi:adenine deaminase